MWGGVTCVFLAVPQVGKAHVFTARRWRAGAYPPYDGSGWFAEVFLNVPTLDLRHYAVLQRCLTGPMQPQDAACAAGDLDQDQDVDLRDFARFQRDFHDAHLLRAANYVAGREPDFTFRTPWIDFPAGPDGSYRDSNFATVGDFLNDYIYDVSDPSKLAEPFGSLFLRFTGLIKIRMSDEIRVPASQGLPVWIDVGTLAYDGYEVRVGELIYRFPNIRYGQPFYHWGPAVEVVGLFPIEIAYLNVYDPNDEVGNPRAGIEVYSWHGGGLPWPAGQQMVHEIYGPATLLPPRVIYQPGDERPVVAGDFEADDDVDLGDFQFYQYCADLDFFFLPTFCQVFDFDGDNRLTPSDFAALQDAMKGPGIGSKVRQEP